MDGGGENGLPPGLVDKKGEGEEQWVDGTALAGTDNASDWDVLLNRRGGGARIPHREFARDSLFIKFDPLVTAKEDSPEKVGTLGENAAESQGNGYDSFFPNFDSPAKLETLAEDGDEEDEKNGNGNVTQERGMMGPPPPRNGTDSANASTDWDALLNRQGGGARIPHREFARDSLFIKFDPLVTAKEDSPEIEKLRLGSLAEDVVESQDRDSFFPNFDSPAKLVLQTLAEDDEMNGNVTQEEGIMVGPRTPHRGVARDSLSTMFGRLTVAAKEDSPETLGCGTVAEDAVESHQGSDSFFPNFDSPAKLETLTENENVDDEKNETEKQTVSEAETLLVPNGENNPVDFLVTPKEEPVEPANLSHLSAITDNSIDEEEIERRNVEILVENLEATIASIKEDTEIAKADLQDMESAFTQILMQYESSKTYQHNLQENISLLKSRIQWFERALERREEKKKHYERLENEMMEKIKVEQEEILQRAQTENFKLRASLKMSDLQIQQMEHEISQVTKDNDELRKLCDEMINKPSTSTS